MELAARVPRGIKCAHKHERDGMCETGAQLSDPHIIGLFSFFDVLTWRVQMRGAGGGSQTKGMHGLEMTPIEWVRNVRRDDVTSRFEARLPRERVPIGIRRIASPPSYNFSYKTSW